jgi:ATP-dependent helicase HrpB
VLLDAGGDGIAAAACAVLAEDWTPGTPSVATACDLWPAIDGLGSAPRSVREAARQLERLARRLGTVSRDADERLRRALFAGYSDRVAQRREPGSRRLRLASGPGAVLLEESGVREGEFLVALDLRAGARGPGAQARVRRASRVERDWLAVTASATVHALDPASGAVRARARELNGALVLSEAPVSADPERAAELLRDALLERGLGERAAAELCRARFAGLEIDLPERLLAACRGRKGWFEFDLVAALDHDERRSLDRLAPATLPVPSGRRVKLDYRGDGTVVAAVKLQELFGLADSPRVGPDRVPVTFSLLAPSGRPVQTTSDLRSFWSTTYAEVRRELRARYPKHPWPDDPWTADPTVRRKRRG